MKRKRRTEISLLLVVALLIGMWLPAAGTQAAETDALAGKNLLAHYEFQNGGEDTSGNHHDAVIGAGVTVADGTASLPGGTADGTQYITLPKGMFDGQDKLTITMWLKDQDPQASWLGAFFFGSGKNANGYPTNYYYFVPCEKDYNSLKSVITNEVNESQPYATEKGIEKNSVKVSTVAYRGAWTHYAIVLKEGSMTCYIDGQQVGTQTLDRKVSDFGTGLDAYIGKSNYADPLYQGDFRDFRVYADVLEQEEIQTVMGRHPDDRVYSMVIDGEGSTKKLSDSLYGLFYEDINSAADGGLYPEMVKNYSFENAYLQSGDTSSSYFKQNGYQTIGNYKLHWDVTGAFEVRDTNPINENNPHYAVITGDAVMKNGGFAPQSDPNGAAMPVKPVNAAEQTGVYTCSVYAKAEAGYAGTVKVKLVDASGKAVTDEQKLELAADGSWHKASAELTSTVTANTKGKMVLTISGAAAADQLSLDMISVVPHDSYGYGNKNYAYGVGVRKDLLELMMDLNPKFMRFPGGCIVEGFNWEGLYDWRDSIGLLEERKACTNRWENWGNQNRTWGYMQSYGFGYHELLSLCEDYHMDAFPILSAGVLCQYETYGVDAKKGQELQRFIDMATDLLDYCWGDPTENEWAAKRAENGHEQPFSLKYLGIGNENFQAKYFDNLDVIKTAVEKYAKEHYPEHTLQIISSAGPTSTGENLEYAYDRLAQTMPGETLVDEHYYESESFMYNQSDRYDYYQRTADGGSDVFVGEYAVKNDNKYNTALAEAAYITGLERNADVVTSISYAPLLYKAGSENWSHDLIYFDEFDTARSTNYYVQKMFAQNYGATLMRTELEAEGLDYSNYGSPILGTYASEASIDKVTIYDEEGNILLEDDFDDASNGWTKFSATKGSGTTEIKDGKLYFKGSGGINTVYLPKAIEEKWKNFKIVVEGAVKTAGKMGLVVGAGHDRQYYWYLMGKNNNTSIGMEVSRANRGETELVSKELGNQHPNRRYQTEELITLQDNDPMKITFNYGANGKLEGSYRSSRISDEKTKRYDFTCDLNQYQTDIYQVVTRDDRYVYVKLVNPDKRAKTMTLKFQNLKPRTDEKVEITMLTGGLDEANAIGREVVAPVSSSVPMTEQQLEYVLPKQSVNVLRIPVEKEEEPKETESETETETEAPQTEAPQTEPQTEAPQTEAPQTEKPQTEAPKTEKPGASTEEKRLKAPTKIKIVKKGKNVKLSWKKIKGAKVYVYASLKKKSGYKKVAASKKNGTSVLIKKGLKKGKRYYFKLAAVKGKQIGIMSKPKKMK